MLWKCVSECVNFAPFETLLHTRIIPAGQAVWTRWKRLKRAAGRRSNTTCGVSAFAVVPGPPALRRPSEGIDDPAILEAKPAHSNGASAASKTNTALRESTNTRPELRRGWIMPRSKISILPPRPPLIVHLLDEFRPVFLVLLSTPLDFSSPRSAIPAPAF